jgi:hypothetical protein
MDTKLQRNMVETTEANVEERMIATAQLGIK